ncbi:alpha/beta fold hydrolase [Sediminicoccus sp. KRV36]|uniref:alpha/beta fold hydrolase n=1 Tax=Sediminicoccus sp. KRV36 TaxID=3133721 RepID=UPI00200F4D5E|nr:alpha/beta fold hydrolase [Sediminicoccus rosea]UPY38066.1 alpha/beta hydrolase [Sediminicoccus rosea]
MKLFTALILALLSLAACAPVVVPAGPATRAAGIEGFEPPPLPWMPIPGWAFAPSPAPPQPSGPRPEAMLVMPDGARLPLRVWRPEGAPRFVILAIHGLADHGGNMLEEGGPLLTAGGALVYAYDQRGFGWTRPRGYWAGAETMVNDAHAALDLIRARHPGLPIFLLGESMGGAVVLAMGRTDVTGIILSSPALWGRAYMPRFLRALLWGAAHVLGPVAMPASAPNITASDNREALLRFGSDPLTLREIRFDMVSGLVDLMDQAVAALPTCCRAVPTLIMVGGNDQVVPTPIARRALRDAGVPRVALYTEGWHLLLRDGVRARVARDIIEFLNMPDVPTSREAAGAAWLARTPP